MTELSRTPLSAEHPLQAGSMLAEKYRLEYEIGRGAMGTVWLATHISLEQRVAIKIISREHARSEELRQRFSTEARAAARLRSRYVVGVYDHGETADGLPFIVLEYLEGECLEDRIAREGTLPLTEAVRIAKHIGHALSRAHAKGIVHRDLKPANIFITHNEDDEERGWIAKVLDFGIAKMDTYGETSTTKTGTVLGTPLFMSPEQVRGASSVDHRADLYSLGMVVYNMLTGGYAFDGASFGDLLVSICTEPLPRLRDAAPFVPQSLEQWFQKACARNPDDRFADADEMVAALGAAAGLESHATRLSFSDASGLYKTGPAAVTAPGRAPGPKQLTAGHPSLADGQAGAKASSVGPASVTISGTPPRRFPRPWTVGAAALVVAAGAAMAFNLHSENSEDSSDLPAAAHEPARLGSPVTPEPEEHSSAEPAPAGEVLSIADLPSHDEDEVDDEPAQKPATSSSTVPKSSTPAARPKPASPVKTKSPAPSQKSQREPAQSASPQKGTTVPDLGF